MLERAYPFARKALFRIDAERAHNLSLCALRAADRCGLLQAMSRGLPASEEVHCMGLTFPNRVGLAAGLDKEGNSIDAFGRLGFGFVEIGTITPVAQGGNPKPRLYRLPAHEAIINRMGFNNPGIEEGVRNVSGSTTFKGLVGFNIGKNKDTPNERAADDYLTCLRQAWPVADYIAVNLSSPNTPGLRALQDGEAAARLLEKLQDERTKLLQETGRMVPLAIKVAPDLNDEEIDTLATIFLDHSLDAIIATNTTLSRVGVEAHRYHQEAGGLSGAPLSSGATKIIRSFHSAVSGKIPIIGVGGIMSASDALAKLNAGATLLQLYSGFIYHGPVLIREILEALNLSKESEV